MIKAILEKSELILTIGLVLSLVFGFSQLDRKNYYKEQEQVQLRNIEALNDSVNYYENLAGELTAQRQAFETSIENLESLNDSLYQEVQKERDQVNYLSQINAELSRDSVEADTSRAENIGIDQWIINWDFSDSGNGWRRALTGVTSFGIDSTGLPYNEQSLLIQDALNIRIITGITERNGTQQIFVRSSYPYIEFTEIQGVVLNNETISEQTPSRFGLGINVGASFSPDGLAVPTFNVGLNYNLITL